MRTMMMMQLQLDLQKEQALSQIRIQERYALLEAQFIEQWQLNYSLEYWKAEEANRQVLTETYHKQLDFALQDIAAKRDAALQAQQTSHEASLEMVKNAHQGQIDQTTQAAAQPQTAA